VVTKINDLTADHIGNVATSDDLTQFKAACWNWLDENPEATEQEAIDYVWGDGDFSTRVAELTEA
jgi:hypothetical protein